MWHRPVAARHNLDERAEVLDARDAAFVNPADLHRRGQRLDAGHCRLGALHVVAGDGHRAVVLDLDHGAGRFLNAADRLAARADQGADLVRDRSWSAAVAARMREISLRGRGIAVSILRRISMRASRACVERARG